jgi:hypothetical protein
MLARLPRAIRAGEAAPRQELDEPRIGAIGIPLGIDRKKDQVNVARRARALQPLERGISLSEALVYQRERVWWDVPLL